MKIIPKVVTRKVGRTVLTAKKNSPHIFFGIGVVGVVGSTVLACKATLKLHDELDAIQADVRGVKSNLESPGTEYPMDRYRKDLAYTYGVGAANLAKLYAPSLVVGTLSIACLTGSHVQLTRRNTALTAAYTAVSTAYENYRARVREEVGEERELEIHRGIEEVEALDEDGKKIKAKVVDPNGLSQYAKIFDELSPSWKKNAEYNKIFLTAQQNFANDMLQSRGHIFLNEVYDMLGLERTQAGQVVGWVISDEGDNHVDFGIFDAGNSSFVNGLERSIILDFNVDGVIYNKF